MAEPAVACETSQEALAGWVVAQLEPAEEARLLAHLDVCTGCRAESDSLLAVAAVTLGADPGSEPWRPAVDEPPPADLADRIVARVARERRGRSVTRMALAAVGTAAVVLASVLVLRADDLEPLEGEQVAFASLAPGVQAEAAVAPEADGSLVQLTATGLDPDLTYALWLTPPGGGYSDRVAAGTFRPDASGRVNVRLHSALAAREMARMWVTTPTGDVALDTEA